MTLDRETIAAVDSTAQLDEVLGLAEHLEDALWRVDSAQARPVDATGGVIVAGMGGSASGGRLAVGALGSRLVRPLVVADGYALPAWAGPSTLVFASSYSGNTEETLSAYEDAAARGCPRLVASTGGALVARAREDGVPVVPIPGGFQPRAAIGYALVGALEAAALGGAAPSVRSEIEAAWALAAELTEEWGPDAPEDSEAKSIARSLHGTVPVIAGAELAGAAAYRWKCQFNENSALPAFASVLPEADHNEVVGWDAAPSLGSFSYVSLEDPGAHPRNALRAELTAEIAAAGCSPVVRVQARGETPVERIVSLVLLGDLVSIYAAVLRSADPVDIPGIDRVKAALSATPVTS
ncbi:bifunctional phosphoglucose/phosphomannose isomerase [Solirubrobacter soli]|uniref:bifunctional phosphoglucose/phosphomannose isomerase n=1 Tax=Solirubrobacter soli TaxID=363832 RepID=UPI0003FD89FA|nr:bifunctional phosphoglucose/phosphomannose isomerase [Solirubrobacter soli]